MPPKQTQNIQHPKSMRCPTFFFGSGPDPKSVPVLDVLINEQYATSGLISTGTSHDFINESFVDRIGANKIQLPSPIPCALLSGSVQINSYVNLKLTSNGITSHRIVYVFPSMRIDLILGISFFGEFQDIIDLGDLTFNGLPMYNP